jgi:hypothetical protein
MSNFKQVVIYFLVSKLPVIYQPILSLYLALSKNTGKNNTTPDTFVVKAPCIESTAILSFAFMAIKADGEISAELICWI